MRHVRQRLPNSMRPNSNNRIFCPVPKWFLPQEPIQIGVTPPPQEVRPEVAGMGGIILKTKMGQVTVKVEEDGATPVLGHRRKEVANPQRLKPTLHQVQRKP